MESDKWISDEVSGYDAIACAVGVVPVVSLMQHAMQDVIPTCTIVPEISVRKICKTNKLKVLRGQP